MSNNAKLVRGQIRQIVKEILPEILKAELQTALYKELGQAIKGQLANLEETVKGSLEAMDKRQKDAQSFVMREIMQSVTAKPAQESNDK